MLKCFSAFIIGLEFHLLLSLTLFVARISSRLPLNCFNISIMFGHRERIGCPTIFNMFRYVLPLNASLLLRKFCKYISLTHWAPFIWRKVVPAEGSLAYPRYPWLANFSYISLQNRFLNKKTKKRNQRLARLEG